jgi:hypothetical protein
MKTFWLVWCDGGGTPTVKHATRIEAKAEAERLARRNEGRTFHVLEVIGSATVRLVDWQERQVHGDGCACDTCLPF